MSFSLLFKILQGNIFMEAETIYCEVHGHTISFETGKIARQAGGAVVIRCGETLVLATACSSPEPLSDIDFLPLRIDYQEKFSSTGKTVSGFIKREGKPTQSEILGCRLIDRPIRPMFPDGYYHDIQIIATVLSYDGVNSPDVLGICASSCALALSSIPLIKPIAGVRVGMVEGKLIVNPTAEQQKSATLDLVLAGTEDAVLMIEGSSDFVTEEQVLEAIELGHSAIKKICETILEFQKQHGKPKKTDTIKPLNEEALKAIDAIASPRMAEILHIKEKKVREEASRAIEKEIIDTLTGAKETPTFPLADLKRALSHYSSTIMRKMILEENIRSDGRKLDEIRPIYIEQGLLPRAHGSSLFTRGETQSLAICVLGADSMGQKYEDLDEEGVMKFYLQYFFPPYSVGEVGRLGAPGRREIGHGKLAERALEAILPPHEGFPYTIRLESNITESNGSSSMASVCGGCLALMDAGVPIKRPVSGIAMGLILEKGHSAILTDILGLEDALGDMDFKVTGDKDGITAFQMDIKVEGITIDIMRKALASAKEGRIKILETMLAVCPAPRPQMSQYAPRIETMQVKPSKIATIIGPGGKQIRAIIEQTGVDIDINDDGIVNISATSPEAIEKAKAIIHGLIAEAEVGKTYTGKITSIVPFGFFVEILPGKEGLLHISEIEPTRIEDILVYSKEHKIKVGDEMTVQVVDINDRGQIKLSRKVLLAPRRAPRPPIPPPPIVGD
jgi:polyribonucleotide nucleotidyltransferase